MSTATATGPRPMSETLQMKAEARMMGDRLRSATKGFRRWVGNAIRFLHLDAAATAVSSALGFVWEKTAYVRSELYAFGPGSIAAAVTVTKAGRSAAAKTLRAVSKATRWVGSTIYKPISWVLNHLGKSGKRADQSVRVHAAQASQWVTEKATKVRTWLEDKHDSPVMRLTRVGLLMKAGSQIARRFIPASYRWIAYVASGVLAWMRDKAGAKQVVADAEAITKAAAEGIAEVVDASTTESKPEAPASVQVTPEAPASEVTIDPEVLQEVIAQASAIAAAAAVAAVQEAAEAATASVVDAEVVTEEEQVPAPTVDAPETSRERIFVEHKETGTVYTAEKVGYANGQTVYVSSDTGYEMNDWDPESSACDWKLIDEKTYLSKLAAQAGDQEVVVPNREARREAKRSNNGRRRR